MLLTVLLACGPSAAEPPACEGWGSTVAAGIVAHPDVTEASGLVASRRHEGVYWAHNDKGDSARLFAIGSTGADQGVLTVLGGAPVDWEDLATGPAPDGGAWLYVGDIGDNDKARETVRIWRIAEPETLGQDQTASGSSTFDLRYPDGAHDAEALLFDPLAASGAGRLFILTKDKGSPGLYEVPDLDSLDGVGELARVGQVLLPEGIEGPRKISGGDVSTDGRRVLLRTEGAVLVYDRATDQDLAEALAGEGCLAPSPEEDNGEALAATAGGFATVGEGSRPTLWTVGAP